MLFPEWDTFYVIVGTSAGALTGLMFVVMALVAEFRGSETQIAAFGTPTVVHFSAVMLISAILAAPWPTTEAAGTALAALGAAATAYMFIVMRRARRQSDYRPVFEDWLFHAALPLAAYISILVAAAGLVWRRAAPMLFVIGGAAVLLLVIGIHNAWDTITYVVLVRWEERRERRNDRNRVL